MARRASPRTRRASSRAEKIDLREVVRAAKAAQGQERLSVETAELAMRAELSALRRSAEKRLEPIVAKGVDLRAAKAVLAGYEKERAKLLKSRLPQLEEAMSAEGQSQSPAARRHALEILATSDLPLIPTTLTLKPFLIWSTNPANMLVDSHADAVGYSWAKISLSRTELPSQNRGSAQSNLVFHHLWTNSSNHAAVVNAKSRVWFNGLATVTANTSILGGTETYLSCQASLSPVEYWNQPPTYQLPQSHDYYWNVFGITATGGSVFSLETGDLEVYTLPGLIRDVRWDLFVIPAGATALFPVNILFNYKLTDGHVGIDFASRADYSIASRMELEVLTSQPVIAPS